MNCNLLLCKFKYTTHRISKTNTTKHHKVNRRKNVWQLQWHVPLSFHLHSSGTLQFVLFLMPNTHRRHRRDATVESSRVGGVYTHTQFATSWRQFRWVWTNLPTAKSAVVTQFTIFVLLSYWGWWQWRRNDVIVEKLSMSIKIHVVKPLCSVSKLSTDSVGSRRELVANSCSHPSTRRYSTVGSSRRRRCVLRIGHNIQLGLASIWERQSDKEKFFLISLQRNQTAT